MTTADSIAMILERGVEVIANQSAAEEWIDKRSATLGTTPRKLAASLEGRDRVLLHLNGISRHRLG